MNRYLRDHILKPLYYHLRRKPFIYSGIYQFYVQRFSDLLFATGAKGHEPETQRWIAENYKEDDVFYDIGAGIGLFSIKAILQGCRVYAFEKDPGAFETLLNNARLNRVLSDHIEAVNCHCVCVDADFTVDDMTTLFPVPNHIKIDTEGMEPVILLGMLWVLKQRELKTLVVESFSHEGFDRFLGEYGFVLDGVSRGDERNRYYKRKEEMKK